MVVKSSIIGLADTPAKHLFPVSCPEERMTITKTQFRQALEKRIAEKRLLLPV